MRMLPVLLAVSLLAFTVPAAAASSNVANVSNGVSFGTAYCKPKFSCPSLSSTEAIKGLTSQVLSTANTCIGRELGIKSSKPLFETSLGLDSNLCLRTKSIPKNESGLTMVPKCCLKAVKNESGTCQVVCIKYGVK